MLYNTVYVYIVLVALSILIALTMWAVAQVWAQYRYADGECYVSHAKSAWLTRQLQLLTNYVSFN